MKTRFFTTATVLVMGLTVTTTKAQEPEEVTFKVGADLVSSYVWRGAYCAGASLQPYANVSYAGLTLGAWGSTDFIGAVKEVDWSLSYEISGFAVMVTDYFGPYGTRNGKAYDGTELLDYFKTGHSLEGTLAYGFDFGLNLAWSTVFVDDSSYSTYIDLGYGFDVKDVACSVNIGLSPWGKEDAWYGKGFNVANIAFTASKSIAITSDYAIGIFTQAVWSPSNKDAYLVAGIGF